MTITWYGHSCFKITNQGGHLTVITDPFDKSIGLTPPRGSADIVTVSHHHSDHDNVKAISGEPFIVDGPGEYEIKGVGVTGVHSFHDTKKGAERGQNTIYVIKVDKIRICHLGDLGQERLSDRQLEAIGQVDILMVPVGGKYTIGAKEAAKISKQIEPQIIIPMHYKYPGLKLDLPAGLNEFLKEMGLEEKTAVEKLTLKKNDLTNGDMKVVVMKI
ncbi:MAG: MBL fold metallo-hydrolase [Patescibacteria group bacterium]|nr:MBL fold metallo-hydrolase [Patescibacteria group bacterium]